AGGQRRHLLESEAVEPDARLLLEAFHHRVAQLALAREVAVNRALVDTRAFGNRAHRQRPPVPDREAVQQLRARDDDALARFRRALPPHRAVVPAARRVDAHRTNTGSDFQPRTVDVEAISALA